MKVKLFAVLMAMFVLSYAASAQGYSIQVTYNTNLRAAPSLQGSIVETAPAGTTLNVVGSDNRWLKINRNGNEVWMADWVSYTRVEEGSQTSSQIQTMSEVDNCCFVDRQCNTDQEWTDGYWAFQNNQCTAPSQSQTQTATSIISSQIDNCCFVNWQCNTDEEWKNGYRAFQNNQCSAPAQLRQQQQQGQQQQQQGQQQQQQQQGQQQQEEQPTVVQTPEAVTDNPYGESTCHSVDGYTICFRPLTEEEWAAIDALEEDPDS